MKNIYWFLIGFLLIMAGFAGWFYRGIKTPPPPPKELESKEPKRNDLERLLEEYDKRNNVEGKG